LYKMQDPALMRSFFRTQADCTLLPAEEQRELTLDNVWYKYAIYFSPLNMSALVACSDTDLDPLTPPSQQEIDACCDGCLRRAEDGACSLPEIDTYELMLQGLSRIRNVLSLADNGYLPRNVTLEALQDGRRKIHGWNGQQRYAKEFANRGVECGWKKVSEGEE
jgi:hypothetical protein